MNDAYGTLTAPDSIRLQRRLPGPIDRVWQYLTEPQLRRQWLADGPFGDAPGARFELTFRNNALTDNDEPAPPKYAGIAELAHTHGRLVECTPPARLVVTWDEDGDEGSEICFELAPHGDEVELTLTHSRLPSRTALISVASGWHAHVGILISLLRGETPAGFWTTHTRLEREYEQRVPASG